MDEEELGVWSGRERAQGVRRGAWLQPFRRAQTPSVRPAAPRRAIAFLVLAVFAVTRTALADAARAPLVFIHGIKGARLIDTQGRQRWLTPAQVLGLRTPRLALPMRWDEDGRQARDDVNAAGVLERVTLLPVVASEDVYATWLDAARGFGRPFFAFTYDWRRDNFETLDLFEAFLDDVRQKTGAERVQVVAHSMGGLITFALVNRRPDLFHSVYFAGVPFAGGIGFLPDLHAGTSTGLNRRILAPEVLGTFPSTYTLFPLENRRVVDERGNPITLDFFSAADWRDNGLGLLRGAPRDAAAVESFLAQTLARAKSFRASLVPREIAYPPMTVVVSRSQATLAEVQRYGAAPPYRWDFDSRPKQPGDGRICEKDAHPPGGLAHETILSERSHSALLNDPAVIEMIRGSVR